MKHIILVILSLFLIFTMAAQPESPAVDTLPLRYKISLITCGTGEELYASFGHTAIRVQDYRLKLDEVYNYGTFSFNEEGFYRKFTLGKLNYWVAKEDYQAFVDFYRNEERFVKEQILDLDNASAEQIVKFLENNARPENKYYKYDFIYDNCATRVRDVFSMSLGEQFSYGQIMRGTRGTYRQVINQYLINNHWSRFGINILLGSRIDSVMTDHFSMFLPDFLYEGMKGAVYEGKSLVTEDIEVVKATPAQERTFNAPFWMTFTLFIITLLVFYIPVLNKLKNLLSFVFLLVSGLLGAFILFMWMMTDHQACDNNWNILWAIPFNLIIAFLSFGRKEWFKIYALAAISCLIVALIVHVLDIQMLPLTELIPYFGCLLFTYMDLYRKGLSVTADKQRSALS